MIKLDDFDKNEIIIIQRLYEQQFKSLKRLYYGNDNLDEIEELIRRNQREAELGDSQYKKVLIKRAIKYRKLQKYPMKLFHIGQEELSSLRHVLAQFDDEWREEYPKAISMIWSKFFFFEKIEKFSFN